MSSLAPAVSDEGVEKKDEKDTAGQPVIMAGYFAR